MIQGNLQKEKEDKIYKEALKEFAQNGYDKGSTNTIVKEAGISKGALFNYFKNKRRLYLYVVNRALKELEQAFLEDIKSVSCDLFERIAEICEYKVKLALKFPMESTITMEAFGVKFEDFQDELKSEYDRYVEISNKLLLENIDYSKFKEEVDVKAVFEMLLYISEGFSKKIMATYGSNYNVIMNNREKINKEFSRFVEIIKNSVYK